MPTNDDIILRVAKQAKPIPLPAFLAPRVPDCLAEHVLAFYNGLMLWARDPVAAEKVYRAMTDGSRENAGEDLIAGLDINQERWVQNWRDFLAGQD